MPFTENHYFLIAKQLNKWFIILLTLCAFFIFLLPLVPSTSVTQLIEFMVYFSPRWIFLIALIPSIIIFFTYPATYRLCITFSFIVYFNYQDFQISIPTSTQPGTTVKILSMNIGGGVNTKYLKNTLHREQPDIILLQEANLQHVKDIFPESWVNECDGGLCFASNYTFKRVGEFERKIISGWGHFANYYELSINGQTLPIMNLHLETPRHILSDALHLNVNWSAIKEFNEKKSTQSQLIETWLAGQSGFVMAGDFNMTVEEQLFQKHFSQFKSAVEEGANGVAYTKYTKWHGVRIDHVLVSDDLRIEDTRILPSVGGDHRAILTTIILPK
jgi:endonuclease/exonuclease/phosphatase family metal-dependent hydrolase